MLAKVWGKCLPLLDLIEFFGSVGVRTVFGGEHFAPLIPAEAVGVAHAARVNLRVGFSASGSMRQMLEVMGVSPPDRESRSQHIVSTLARSTKSLYSPDDGLT